MIGIPDVDRHEQLARSTGNSANKPAKMQNGSYGERTKTMTTAELTQDDVQLHTGTNPAEHSHILLKRDWKFGEPVEALCGYVFTPQRKAESFPVCPGCKAVFDDNEARSLAAGWRGKNDY